MKALLGLVLVILIASITMGCVTGHDEESHTFCGYIKVTVKGTFIDGRDNPNEFSIFVRNPERKTYTITMSKEFQYYKENITHDITIKDIDGAGKNFNVYVFVECNGTKEGYTFTIGDD